jgi:hypothetical protein
MKENEEKERKLSFKCCVPREMSSCTVGELQLSFATLKNALINITICMTKLERELEKRGASTSLFRSMNEEQTSELLELATIRE